MIVFVECGCEPGVPYADDARPEYYTSESAALARFKFHVEMGTYFWGVHLDGRHMLIVEEPPFSWGGLTGKSRIR